MKITEFVYFPPSFRLFLFLSFSFLHCSVSVRYCMHHFRLESIFFLGSSLSISENFKMHCNILAPDGWLAGFSWFVRQPYWDTRFIHLHTHTRHCIASHSVVSFLDNIHFASMKHAQHTLHMSSRCECVCVWAHVQCTAIHSSEMGTDSLEWKLRLYFGQFHDMRASLEQWHDASLKFASDTHAHTLEWEAEWEWEQKIGMRTMMHVHRIPLKSTKTEWQKVFLKWVTQCTVQP